MGTLWLSQIESPSETGGSTCFPLSLQRAPGGLRKPLGDMDAPALSTHFSCPVLTTLSTLTDCKPSEGRELLTLGVPQFPAL